MILNGPSPEKLYTQGNRVTDLGMLGVAWIILAVVALTAIMSGTEG